MLTRTTPLAGTALPEQGFAKTMDIGKEIAPILSVLEGGYNLDALALSVEQHLRSMSIR